MWSIFPRKKLPGAEYTDGCLRSNFGKSVERMLVVSDIFSIIKIKSKMVFDDMAYLLYGKLFSNVSIFDTSLKRSVMTDLKINSGGSLWKVFKMTWRYCPFYFRKKMNPTMLIIIDKIINWNFKSYFLFEGGDRHTHRFSSIVSFV